MDSMDNAVSDALAACDAERRPDAQGSARDSARSAVDAAERRECSPASSASPATETIGLCSDGACFAAAQASTADLAHSSTGDANFADDSFDPGAATPDPHDARSTTGHSRVAGVPLDTPDRALLAAQLLNTPEPSPDLSLPTCGFVTSTVDGSMARPSPMMHSPMHSPRPERTTSPAATGALPRPTPADPRAPRPLLPTASLPYAPLGRASDLMRSSAAFSTAADARQSIANVQFCEWDDPQLHRAALSLPVPVVHARPANTVHADDQRLRVCT